MENCSNEYLLKSNVRNILYHHPKFMDCDASVNHDDVIAVLWAWSYHCYGHDVSDQANDHARLLELMRLELGDEAVEDIDNGGHSHFYKLRLPNATWYVKVMKSAYAISLLPDGRNLSIEYSFRSPEENMTHILSFDSYIPQIHDLIDQIQEGKTKENLIRNMIAASATGIIEQVREEEHLDIPRIVDVKGTLKRKVYVKFEGIDKELSCPLDYLRVRLIRRFGREKR